MQISDKTDHTATLIDNIFFNSLEHLTLSGNIVSDISDHLPNFLINKISELPNNNLKLFKRNYSNFNAELFEADVSNIDWYNVLPNDNNVNNLFQSFHSEILKVVDRHAPVTRISRNEVKTMSKSWITSGIRKSIKRKNKLYNKYLSTKNEYYKSKYKCYRNKLNHLQRISKKIYYENYFTANNKNIKNTWTGIKQLITLKPRGHRLPTKIIKDGQEIKDTKNISLAFNEYFSNIGKNIADSVPCTNTRTQAFMGSSVPNSFFMSPVLKSEIECEIGKLKSSKATGPFSIPINLLKTAKSSLSTPLEIIFNLSFLTGTVPDQFKIANVIPIHKKGPLTMLTNYRPISLLSIFSKILEKLMYTRLTRFIEKYEILYNKQFGFRSKHSTLHDNIQQPITFNKQLRRDGIPVEYF